MFLGYNFRIMKRWLAFWRWVVGAAIVFGTIFFVACQQHRAAEKYKRHRQEYCSALVALPEQKKACIEKGASANDYLPWGYELLIWPEGMTTWAIIATGFFIAWQSFETRKAAKAALLNAQAVINSERPWIVPKAAIVGGAFVVTGENRGRTPALILSSWGRYIFTDNPDDLPEPPEYTDGSQLVEYTFLTGDDPPFTAWQHPNLKHRFAPGKPEWAEGHLVYFYGRVRYADPSITNHPKTGVVYESRWCYQFIRPSIHALDGHIMKGGHYSYNVYT